MDNQKMINPFSGSKIKITKRILERNLKDYHLENNYVQDFNQDYVLMSNGLLIKREWNSVKGVLIFKYKESGKQDYFLYKDSFYGNQKD